MAANYMLLHDNALDRTHFPYVHPHRIHRGYVEDPPPLQIEVAETTVSYSRTFTPAPLADWQHEATGLPPTGSTPSARPARSSRPPCTWTRWTSSAQTGARVFRGVFIRAFTPVDAGRTLIIWRAARNYARDDESVTERLRRCTRAP